MSQRVRIVLWVGLLLACGLPGCVKLRQAVTLMPDGSGKVELRIGLSEKLVALAEEQEQDAFEKFTPEQMNELSAGFVAFTEPVKQKQGGFTYLSFTGYFRDINKLRIEGVGMDDGTPSTFQYERKGDSATLRVTGGMVLSVAKENEPAEESERKQLREVMAGLELQEHFVLPGNFKTVEGVVGDGNTAKIDLSLDQILEGSGPIKTLKTRDALTFEIAEITIKPAAVDAFKQEMEAAVKAWRDKRDTQDKARP